MEQESVVDGNLATEASLIVLDTLEIIVKVAGHKPASVYHLHPSHGVQLEWQRSGWGVAVFMNVTVSVVMFRGGR